MEQTMNWAREQAIRLLHEHGYWAVPPALLVDPGGIPWLWIFVMLLAERAGKNIVLLLVMGMACVSLVDHALYWIGVWGGRPLVDKIAARFPKICEGITQAENAMRGHGVWTIVIGRLLPLVGRWVGLASGLVRMPYARFTFFNAIGASITVIGFGLLAHFVGEKTVDQPWFPHALALTFLIGIVFTAALLFAGWVRNRRAHTESL